ncbi:neutral zinc metallopeptidase [Nonomuraea rhizosphaerae]|uniref:neutral zinc metallopeptidase n=1 Tax=Nonomuraea rhizosphaerae TaxID=2665663 RepID=UPI001C5D079B|nr:neutral zinc metallopeptidase [Nonomuraea rhizosphaerae]
MIRRAYDRHPYKGKKELYEQGRREELQAQCLAGVFMGIVWKSLDRTDRDWRILLDIERAGGDEQSEVPDHGRGPTSAAWLEKGFRSVSPAGPPTRLPTVKAMEDRLRTITNLRHLYRK